MQLVIFYKEISKLFIYEKSLVQDVYYMHLRKILHRVQMQKEAKNPSYNDDTLKQISAACLQSLKIHVSTSTFVVCNHQCKRYKLIFVKLIIVKDRKSCCNIRHNYNLQYPLKLMILRCKQSHYTFFFFLRNNELH